MNLCQEGYLLLVLLVTNFMQDHLLPPHVILRVISQLFHWMIPLDNNSSSNVMPSDVDHTTRDQYWSPGQTLPPFSPQPTVRSDADFAGEQSFFVLQSMIQGMHKDIQSNFQSINDQITRLEVRIDTIERKESPPSVSETPASSTGDSSTDSSSTKSRKRRSTSELQVSVINVCIHHS